MSWSLISCEEFEVGLFNNPEVRPQGGRFDIGGLYGRPQVLTEYGVGNETPVFKSVQYYKHPHTFGNSPMWVNACEHFKWIEGEE